MSNKTASPAQAKYIAHIWSDHRKTVRIMVRGRDDTEPYNDPTTKACVNAGWLTKTDGLPFFENGNAYEPYALSDAGLMALERYLRETRQKRQLSSGQGTER